ncbi:Elongation of very long chain fatty acids protein 6 [Pseudolycoriella hygida]|uniref:Elongation of very long chain fatty acids protein n=1 Tax=Pseudolycoriella hygida TaxID=35572 RepID=A0A9Q0RWE8_9DIPT|nr:Elongation of very long chain fatty acids protein 6 [Pseudolycoriella hygida]
MGWYNCMCLNQNMAAKFIPINLTEPDYISITDYERNFDLTYWRKTFGDGYWAYSVYFTAIYVVSVFGGSVLMHNRQPFKLNGLLTVWNIGLAAMSMVAFSRCVPEFVHILFGENGFHNSICEWKNHNPATAFWSFVLLLSKVVELGDTAFIVLRKQKLLFLHWYHHVTTLMSWWVMFYFYEPNQLWYIVMNSFVHSLMYTYYALRAMKITLPRVVAMLITTVQLLQMVFGVIVNIYTIRTMYFYGTPADCPHRNWFGLQISFGIYIPYTILFLKLFIDSYVVKKQVKPKKAYSCSAFSMRSTIKDSRFEISWNQSVEWLVIVCGQRKEHFRMASDFLMVEVVEPDYISLTDYERNFDMIYWRKFFREHWMISVYLSVIYLVLAFGGAYLMKNRKPFKLNGILTVWNIGLSIMSIWAFCRAFPEGFNHLLNENGFYYTVCEWKNHNSATALSGFVIMVSKVVEFGDTAFIVLRKQDLKFIHYYHHVVTAVSWWYMYSYYEPVQAWYVVMNAFVHSLMYPYFALRAMKISVPKIVAVIITSFQIIQMIIGVYVNAYSGWKMYIVGTPADCPHRFGFGVLIGFGIYFIFSLLFAKFFIENYVGKGKVKSKKV